MRKLILILVSVVAAAATMAQIKLEQSFINDLKPFQLDNGEIKLMAFSEHQKELLLYNIDKSLWKTIPLNVPNPKNHKHYFNNIESITMALFNTDSKIEVMYFCYELEEDYMLSGEGTVYNEVFDLAIINEQGEDLIRVSNAIDYTLFLKDKKNKKLRITTIDESKNKTYVLYKF